MFNKAFDIKNSALYKSVDRNQTTVKYRPYKTEYPGSLRKNQLHNGIVSTVSFLLTFT